jgi:hypothetical protein
MENQDGTRMERMWGGRVGAFIILIPFIEANN